MRRLAQQPALFEARPHRPRAKGNLEDQVAAAGLPEPDPEYIFALPRRWRFDYAWPPWKIALEIEGGTFGRLIVVQQGYELRKGQSIRIEPGTRVRLGGRHNTGEGLQEDAAKYNRAAILGWLVIRATTVMVRDGAALRDLRAAFQARGLE